MFPIILGLVMVLLLALVIMALVAIPARREGRDVFTPRGEEVIIRVQHPRELAPRASLRRKAKSPLLPGHDDAPATTADYQPPATEPPPQPSGDDHPTAQ